MIFSMKAVVDRGDEDGHDHDQQQHPNEKQPPPRTPTHDRFKPRDAKGEGDVTQPAMSCSLVSSRSRQSKLSCGCAPSQDGWTSRGSFVYSIGEGI